MARRLILAAVLSLVTLPLLAATERQRVAMIGKPSVVRIADGYYAEIYYDVEQRTFKIPLVSLGSGSFIDPNGYIVTNAHVTQITHDGDEAARQDIIRRYLQIIAREANTDPNALTEDQIQGVLSHSTYQMSRIQTVITPSGERFPFEIKAYGAPVGQGKDVCIIKVETKNAPILKIGDSDRMHVEDHVTVIGYPVAADTDVLDEKSSLEASITDGNISARKKTAEGAPVLQISAPATHGSSGGPVLNDQGEIIGLLTFRGDEVNEQEVQGFTFAVAASTVQEFVTPTGANNAFGPVDTLWREGLDLFAQHKYTPAIEKFEELRRLSPKHSEAERLISEAQQEINAHHDVSTSKLPLLLAGGGALFIGLFLIIGLAVFLTRRQKNAAVPAYAQQPQYRPQMPYAPQPSFAPAGSPQMPTAPSFIPTPDKTVSVSWLGTIQFTSGPLAGQSFEIGPNGVYIGRDATVAEIVIHDDRVSKRHAWVGPKNGEIVVIDMGSTNGTFLNAKHSARIKETTVRAGDVVIVSDDIARFQVNR